MIYTYWPEYYCIITVCCASLLYWFCIDVYHRRLLSKLSWFHFHPQLKSCQKTYQNLKSLKDPSYSVPPQSWPLGSNLHPQCPCPSTPPVKHCHSRLPVALVCRLFVIFMIVRNVTYFRSTLREVEWPLTICWIKLQNRDIYKLVFKMWPGNRPQCNFSFKQLKWVLDIVTVYDISVYFRHCQSWGYSSCHYDCKTTGRNFVGGQKDVAMRPCLSWMTLVAISTQPLSLWRCFQWENYSSSGPGIRYCGAA